MADETKFSWLNVIVGGLVWGGMWVLLQFVCDLLARHSIRVPFAPSASLDWPFALTHLGLGFLGWGPAVEGIRVVTVRRRVRKRRKDDANESMDD